MIKDLGLVGLYTLYDKVAEQYGPTFEAINTSTAIRSVQSMKIKAYEDFELINVGTFNRGTGELRIIEPVNIEWASPQYKKEINPDQQILALR